MPIAPNFLGGGAGSGITLPPATNIITQEASGKVYIRWTDPNDVVIQAGTLAMWAGTLVVRQQGGVPANRFSGTVIYDNRVRNQFQEDWYCDSGLTNGNTYFYRLIPYSTDGFYTYDDSCCFSVTPHAIDPGSTSGVNVVSAGDGKLGITWDDPNGQYPLGDKQIQSLTVSIEPEQDGSGDPSPTNVRALSGWTYADIVQDGSSGTDTDTATYHVDFVNDTDNTVTAYGGTLDVVSGTLTLDRFIRDLSSLSFTLVNGVFKANSGYTQAIDGDDGVCSHYPTAGDNSVATSPDPSISFNSHYWDSNNRIYVKDSRFSTVDAFKTWCTANSVKYVTRFAPITYQLTPHEIKTLVGENRYSANCGNVEAVYNSEDVLSEWDHSNVIVKADGWASGPNDTGVFTYSSDQLDAYRTTPLIATGLTNGTTYYVTVFPVSTDGAVNTSTANRSTGIPGLIPISAMPVQSGTLTYDGSNQSPEWDYDSTQMTISCTAQTNAGTYEASVTPNADYCWSDGTTSARTIQWTIGKAALPKPTLSDTSITLNASNAEDTFTVTRDGDGAVSAVSSNTNIVTVTATGNTTSGGKIFRVSSVNNTNGTATVTIHVAEGTNYLAYTADDVTCNVSAQFIPTVLNDATWAQISEASLAGTASSYWEVGDEKEIKLEGWINTLRVNTTIKAFILGFDHNAALESDGAHSIHFGIGKKLSGTTNVDICLVDSQYLQDSDADASVFDQGAASFSMNHFVSSGDNFTNMGGWKSCDLRYDVLGSTNVKPLNYPSPHDSSAAGYDPSNYDIVTSPVTQTFMSVLPVDLRRVMRPIKKYTDNFGVQADQSATASVDYLPLLSEYEVCATSKISNSYEATKQKQYNYYYTGNPKTKYAHNNPSTHVYYWMRSPDKYSETGFATYDGDVISAGALTSLGLAPIFMV